jgi:hypothetical protein
MSKGRYTAFPPGAARGVKGKLKGRAYQSQDTMLTAHPELHEKAAGERAKKEEAEDKLKQGDKTRTEAYAKEGERKTAAGTR